MLKRGAACLLDWNLNTGNPSKCHCIVEEEEDPLAGLELTYLT